MASMKLLIRNLSRDTSEESLSKLFSQFGSVQSCNVVLDAETGASKGFGFVEMPKAGEAKVAIAKLNGCEHDGSKLRVKKAKPKPAEPTSTDD